jgi:hypothetical protein
MNFCKRRMDKYCGTYSVACPCCGHDRYAGSNPGEERPILWCENPHRWTCTACGLSLELHNNLGTGRTLEVVVLR